ncbi:hypothetical protein [Campylobacter concisus]|jgi:hypothetical protein|uniref:hypothetical protein n=1 Tax=Campylobacter concisus TaxID=199 RepID=UPI0009293CB2|nr:hypothetical protein [Campylobacter concisus]OJJ27672.1 hypothetical protein TH67_09810 [Campylobacter concisus]
MKRYKNKNNEIYAYEDDIREELLNQRIKELGLIPISDDEANKLLEPKVDEKARALAQLEADINECEDDIKHALIIGNTAVLESLRNEYKELIIQREGLK